MMIFAGWSCLTFDQGENAEERALAEEQAMLDLFYDREEGRVSAPEVLTDDVTGEEGVWGQVSRLHGGSW